MSTDVKYSKPNSITIEVNVDRVTTEEGVITYVLGHTPGLCIDQDRCVHVSDTIVKGDRKEWV